MLYPLELRARTQFDCTLRLPPVKPDYLAALYYPTGGRFVSSSSSRLAYIDWMRGLACVLMFQTHCYDSWLGDGARKSTFFMWSQLGGTLPAPLFLFLAGVSFALVVDKLRQKDLMASQIARTTIRRGAEIFGLGLLFRVQEYLIAWGWAPWSDLFRVDILNTIGISMMLMGVNCGIVFWIARSHQAVALVAGGGVALIYLARWFDARPWQLYPVYDYWHTSPNFFLVRVGLLLIILSAVYAWCRWGAGQWGFSPLIQLGQTSLLVYWVHIEFVYGRFSILPKRAQDIRTASLVLLTIFLSMLLLSVMRTKLKGRGADVLGWFRKPVSA